MRDGKLQIGLVFDVGGRGDKSFNDSAYNGLEIAKRSMAPIFSLLSHKGKELIVRRLCARWQQILI